MKKYFYQHIISEETTYSSLDDLNLSENEKKHLKNLIDQRLHIRVMDIVLTNLSEPDKKAFLNLVHMENHDLLWNFLHTKIVNAEEKIEETMLKTLDELKKDVDTLKEE